MGKKQINPQQVNFGNRLRSFREKANLSQEQIHYATGVTQTQISKIESGKNNPRLTTLYKLSQFFGHDHRLLILNTSIPSSTELQRNVNKYLSDHDIKAEVFIRKGLTRIIKTELDEGKFFTSPRFTAQVGKFLKDKYKVTFSTSRISDTLEELRKKGFIEKLPTNKKSKFQYRKPRVKQSVSKK